MSLNVLCRRYFVSNWGDEMTIGFTAMQFIAGGGGILSMTGAKIEINGRAAPPQLLRCLDPPTNVSERDLPVKFCLPYAPHTSFTHRISVV